MKLRIKDARERAGYTQTELAQLIGVAPNTFCGYENGLHDPKSKLLKLIAKECHTSIDYLLGVSENPNPYHNENAPEPVEQAEGGNYEVALYALHDMMSRLGWLSDDGDISDEDRRFMCSVASMLNTYFEEHR